MFSKKSKRRRKMPAIPENLASYIRMAPAEATVMRCQIIYSASPGMSGLLFQGWRDEDGDFIEASGEKPPYASTIPTPVAEYYFDNTNNTGKLDLDMMREHLGIRVEYIEDEGEEESYIPRHLSTDSDEDDKDAVAPTDTYQEKHRERGVHGASPRDKVSKPHLTPDAMEKAKKRREKASKESGKRAVKASEVKQNAGEDEELPMVAPRSNPRSR